jgi:cell division protein FtsB
MKRTRPQATRNPFGFSLRWRRASRTAVGSTHDGSSVPLINRGRGALALGLAALIVAFISLLIVNFVQQVIQGASLDKRYAALSAEVAELAAANEQLATAVAYSESPAYVERVAREQLGYGREGDVVIRPYLAPTSQSGVEPSSTDDTTPISERSVENWRLWWRAFFPPELPSQE